MMGTTKNTAASGIHAAHDLRAVMQGQVLLPADAQYAGKRQVWNGAGTRLPALFAKCETSLEVRAGQAHALAVWARRSLRVGRQRITNRHGA
jgi:hypothetical protein